MGSRVSCFRDKSKQDEERLQEEEIRRKSLGARLWNMSKMKVGMKKESPALLENRGSVGCMQGSNIVSKSGILTAAEFTFGTAEERMAWFNRLVGPPKKLEPARFYDEKGRLWDMTLESLPDTRIVLHFEDLGAHFNLSHQDLVFVFKNKSPNRLHLHLVFRKTDSDREIASGWLMHKEAPCLQIK